MPRLVPISLVRKKMIAPYKGVRSSISKQTFYEWLKRLGIKPVVARPEPHLTLVEANKVLREYSKKHGGST